MCVYRLDEQIRQAVLSLETKWTEKEIGFQVELEEVKYTANEGLFMHRLIIVQAPPAQFVQQKRGASPDSSKVRYFKKLLLCSSACRL